MDVRWERFLPVYGLRMYMAIEIPSSLKLPSWMGTRKWNGNVSGGHRSLVDKLAGQGGMSSRVSVVNGRD